MEFRFSYFMAEKSAFLPPSFAFLCITMSLNSQVLLLARAALKHIVLREPVVRLYLDRNFIISEWLAASTRVYNDHMTLKKAQELSGTDVEDDHSSKVEQAASSKKEMEVIKSRPSLESLFNEILGDDSSFAHNLKGHCSMEALGASQHADDDFSFIESFLESKKSTFEKAMSRVEEALNADAPAPESLGIKTELSAIAGSEFSQKNVDRQDNPKKIFRGCKNVRKFFGKFARFFR